MVVSSDCEIGCAEVTEFFGWGVVCDDEKEEEECVLQINKKMFLFGVT